MKNKVNRKYFVIAITGLLILIIIFPISAKSFSTLVTINQINISEIHTYETKATFLYCLITDQTNVHYKPLFLHRFIMDKNQTIGIYKDITVKGNAQILELWYPLLGKFNLLSNCLFSFDNKDVTLEIKLLVHGSIHEYINPDSFEVSGRAIGVTLTIEE